MCILYFIDLFIFINYTSRGTDTSRFLTLAKSGAIIGEPTLCKLLVSEVVAQGAESHKIVASANVDDVLASAPVVTVDTYEGPKRKGRPPEATTKSKPTAPVRE
jgi:hypothetical protein